MQPAALGLTFRETMRGGFALGETDPAAGEARGKAAGTELAMHATILIEDLDAFTEDPNHDGRITGTVSFPPLGEHLPAERGAFRLFSPAGDPATRHMVYEFAFTHDGDAYYLAGKKEVRDDPGFDMWADVTTLFTRLHRGTDASGPVVGAGVLRLSVTELAKLVSTMHPTGATSAKESVAAVAKFGKFFLGELWDRYAGRAASEPS